ncbi:MAG TPA: beta-1,3-glucanase family protein [Geobacteraceae bacterium]|nr:beta-1,3-glucanase family protein [Geobacteraceae bacterium]
MKMTAKRTWYKLCLMLLISFVFVLAGCSSDTPTFATRANTGNTGLTNTGLTNSSSGLKITIKNNSGRTAYVKFTGDSLAVDPNDVSIASGGSTDFTLTSVSSGRIYISYDKALSSDAPDGANKTDPDYLTRFDKIELSYNQGGGGTANLTAVDFYAIPMILETSIQGTTIEHLTLADGQTGSGVDTAITGTGILSDPSSAVIKGGKNGTETVRILSPVKSPQAYTSFDAYLDILAGSKTPTTLSISGTFYGTPSQSYTYTGTIDTTGITLNSASNAIFLPMSTLKYNSSDSTSHNGIYTCNSPYYTIDKNKNQVIHHVADNDIYAAVYRDLVTGFNLGFVKPGIKNDSTGWWQSTSIPFQGTSYNGYAEVIANNYRGAYGFPFTDRYTHILADLGGKIDTTTITIDTMTITILDDNTSPAPYNPQGISNPQTGTPKFNLVLITSDANFANTTFTFDTHTYNGGNAYEFPTKWISSVDVKSAQVNDVPTQNGLNIYSFLLGGEKYSVFVQVDNGTVSWGSMAGGASAKFDAKKINLYVGL